MENTLFTVFFDRRSLPTFAGPGDRPASFPNPLDMSAPSSKAPRKAARPKSVNVKQQAEGSATSSAKPLSEAPHEEDEGPNGHLAILLGLGLYGDGTELPGAVSGAQAFLAWLMDPDAGGLDAFDTEMMCFGKSAEFKEPSSPDLVSEALHYFDERLQRSDGIVAQRLYIYASGLTQQDTRAQGSTLLLTSLDESRERAVGLDLMAFADLMRGMKAFNEVVLFVDGMPLDKPVPHVELQDPGTLPRKQMPPEPDSSLFKYFIAEGWVHEDQRSVAS